MKQDIGHRRSWRIFIVFAYLLATVQVAACYFTLVRPYINTVLYESGQERLPFQTRILMMPIMRWAHSSHLAAASSAVLSQGRFWYLRQAEPEAMVQLWINIASLLVAGYVALKIYQGARGNSARPNGFLAVFVYPVFLLLFTCHYILHTIQNFRFLYDLPSVAFFAVGLYLIYFRKHPLLFGALFIVATVNRETTLLLLPFYSLSVATRSGEFRWKRMFSRNSLVVVLPLAALWAAWHLLIFHIYKHNVSEYYPRISINLYTMAHPRYWPQLLSAGGYMLPFVILFRRSIVDRQLRAWLLALPIWFGFMFFWGILVETRVFGELLPYLSCLAVLVAEDQIRVHMGRQAQERPHALILAHEPAEVEAA